VNVNPDIYLYPPDSSGLEASETGLNSSKMLDHQLAQTGLYTIIVNDQRMDAQGSFSISLSKTPAEKSLGIYNPFPPAGSSVDVACGNFSWDAVIGATGYDIYFGENVIEPTVLIVENLPTSSVPFPDILPFTVYCWHVIAHTPGEDVQGPVWWF
jgi:hypothetical protein